MKPGLARFESVLEGIKKVHVDVDDRNSLAFQQYAAVMQRRSRGAIPYTALLDGRCKVVLEWVGNVPAETLIQETRQRLAAP
ncbi:MAG: hypothetical protein HY319_18455 [Armatimonadetes bacterium]|nr:hypothetical protein [Armatimonadota bacterium]